MNAHCFCCTYFTALRTAIFAFLLADVKSLSVLGPSMPAEPLGLPCVGLKLNSGGFFYARTSRLACC